MDPRPRNPSHWRGREPQPLMPQSAQISRDRRKARPPLVVDHVDIDGHRIRTARSTAAEPSLSPPLLIINGFGANLENLYPLMDSLAGRDLITFDIPGLGGSDKPLIPIRLKGLANLTDKLLDHYQVDCVDIMGVSWGGFLAQEFARRHKGRCRRLVLVSTSTGSLVLPGRSPLSLLAPISSALANLANIFNRKVLDARTLGREEKAALAHYHSLSDHRRAHWGRLHQLFSCWGWTSAHWLHKLTQPTLIMAGIRDPLLSIANARFMASRIPDSHIIEVNGGHFFLFMLQDEIIRRIEAFLSP